MKGERVVREASRGRLGTPKQVVAEGVAPSVGRSGLQRTPGRPTPTTVPKNRPGDGPGRLGEFREDLHASCFRRRADALFDLAS